MNLIRAILFPFSLLYGTVIFFRNLFYDLSIIESKSFDISVISVGNLSVGGTGKSPHIEYLIRLLKAENKIATLSRGYGRTTDGFILAKPDSGALEIGDEPRQFKQKFPEIDVAVDSDRVRGIKKLLENNSGLNVILLDDAFQHRAVKPGLSVLLTDYKKLYKDDFLLPSGTLREWKNSANRADIIVVTRIPEYFSPMERRIIKEQLKPKPYQNIYFSYVKYGEFIPVNKKKKQKVLPKEFYFERNFSVLLLTGIASSMQLYDYLKTKVKEIRHLKYRDHHRYSLVDVKRIKQLFDNIANDNKIIITTEKDAMRLAMPAYEEIIQDLPIFYIPIEIDFHEKDAEEFNEQILSYVRKNQVNRRIYKKQS